MSNTIDIDGIVLATSRARTIADLIQTLAAAPGGTEELLPNSLEIAGFMIVDELDRIDALVNGKPTAETKEENTEEA